MNSATLTAMLYIETLLWSFYSFIFETQPCHAFQAGLKLAASASEFWNYRGELPHPLLCLFRGEENEIKRQNK